MAVKTLVSNRIVNSTGTTPSVNLTNSGSVAYTATMDATMPVGTSVDFTIQASPNNQNANFVDVSNNHIEIDSPTNKFGGDATHHVEGFTLYGAGPWWRVKITNLTGSFTINTLTVTDT